MGIGGTGYLLCAIELSERLSNCEALDDPAGYHFGAAAVALVPKFRIRPQTVNGVPVQGGKVIIPLRFEPPPGAKPVRALWTNAPTAADVAAAAPRRSAATGGGVGVMRCTINGGALNDCRPAGDPKDPFARAAMKLAPKFATTPTFADGRSSSGSIFDIAVIFDSAKAKPWSPAVDNPVRFIHAPTNAQKNAVFPAAARDGGVTHLMVTEACVVAPDGSLDRCKTEEEKPVGVGGAQAAGRLVNAFQLPVWTVQGRPVAGAPVTIDIVWDNPLDVKPSAGRPPYH